MHSGTFFITRPSSTPNTSQLSNYGGKIISPVPKVAPAPSSPQTELINSQLQNYYDALNEEQLHYEQMNDMELKIMDLNSSKRKLNSEIQSMKSELQLTKLVAASQIKSMNSYLDCSVEILKNKMERSVGETTGMSSYASQQIGLMKKENEIFAVYFEKLKQRISNLENEIGIEGEQ